MLRVGQVTRLMLLLCSCILTLTNTEIHAQSTLSVEQAVEQALKSNWDIIIAHSDAEIAHTNNTWATSGAYPTVQATASGNESQVTLDQKLSSGLETHVAGVSQSSLQALVALNWKIFDGMKMFATKSRLEELDKSGELQFRNKVSQTIYDVSIAYYNLVRYHQQLRVTNELLSVLQERMKLAELRYNNGSSAKTDYLQAQIDFNDQQTSVLSLKKSIQQAESVLAQLMGSDQSNHWVVSDSIQTSNQIPLSEIAQQSQTSNYALLVAQRDLSIALAQRREIYSQGLPSLSINGGFSYSRSSNSAGFSLLNQSTGPIVGFGLSVPLFNGMQTQTQLDVQDIVIRKSEQQLSLLKTKVRLAYESALADYNSAQSILSIQRSNLDLARENSSIAMERFRKESITSVELHQIQLSVLQEATNLLNTQWTAKAAELQLLLLAGRLNTP